MSLSPLKVPGARDCSGDFTVWSRHSAKFYESALRITRRSRLRRHTMRSGTDAISRVVPVARKRESPGCAGLRHLREAGAIYRVSDARLSPCVANAHFVRAKQFRKIGRTGKRKAPHVEGGKTRYGTGSYRGELSERSRPEERPPMKAGTLFLAAMLGSALGTPAALAGPKSDGGASSYPPGSGGGGVTARNSAPGQQMLNRRTSATAPGNSFNAPGQKMIRKRTPGGTPMR
jgi:hypothetical protein